MSEGATDDAFREARDRVEEAHKLAEQNLKAKIEKAKAEALKKLIS